MYRLATVGPVVSAPRASPRRPGAAFVLDAVVTSLSHREVPRHRPSTFPSISQELSRNANRKSRTPVTAKSPTAKCPMVRPPRYSTLQKPISGYQPQVGSDRVALINLAVRTLGNVVSNKSWSVSIRPKIYHGYLLCNVIYSSHALTHTTSSKTRTTPHTSYCACNLPKIRPPTECDIPVQ